jgi:hypothetical protein
MALGLNDFEAGKFITRAIGRGGPFWAQLALASLVAISGPKKVSIFRARPGNGPRNGLSLIKIIKSKRHIINRYGTLIVIVDINRTGLVLVLLLMVLVVFSFVFLFVFLIRPPYKQIIKLPFLFDGIVLCGSLFGTVCVGLGCKVPATVLPLSSVKASLVCMWCLCILCCGSGSGAFRRPILDPTHKLSIIFYRCIVPNTFHLLVTVSCQN